MKTLIFTLYCCIFATFVSAQCDSVPAYPQFAYISTMQVNEDRFGIDSNYNRINVSVERNGIRLESQEWDEFIPLNWDLQYLHNNRNGVSVYQFHAVSDFAEYIIPTVYKDGKWITGYLIERPAMGLESTQYATKHKRTIINQAPRYASNQQRR